MSTDPALLPATSMIEQFRRKTLSPVEVTEAALARIDAHNGTLNAFNVIDAEGALAQAKDSEARWAAGKPQGLIDGVPVSVKDLVMTRDWPTGRGSKTAPLPAGEDGPPVARLREHGGVILGKTTTPEFGWKGVTDSPLTGITRNPWNPDKTPGGSSGGAAVAAAAGMGALNIGNDGGGSIRIPAGFTGIFGIKPSFGRVLVHPASAMGSLSHTGPMTRTVADSALMLTVMAEPDRRDWTSLPYDGRDYRNGLDDGVRGLRIAYSPDIGHATVHPEVAARVKEAVETFVELGAHVEEVKIDLSETKRVFRVHWHAGAARIVEMTAPDERQLLEEGLREVAAEGKGYDCATYSDAMARRNAIGHDMQMLLSQYDLLMTPTLPIPAFTAGEELSDPSQERWTEWTPFSFPFNLTQQPAATCPCGFTDDGLPIGLQIVGPLHDEPRVFRAARAYETAHPFKMPDL